MKAKSQSQKGGSMIIINGNECKDFICITLEMKTLSKFAKEAEINYDRLSKSLNGQGSYPEIRETFKKWNVPYRIYRSTRFHDKRKNRRIPL
ncbi:hypothetical protein QMM61_04220 [Leptospira santarosai]|uniref:hypothetical protein n=1 Tax=Leptospira santarosai TaxID=28183 RepID=UPI0024AFC30F|nr:hypothetical protein [Leptospira santarosai]MDI7195911.1 hypothetical protein [Leptospira santarosai]